MDINLNNNIEEDKNKRDDEEQQNVEIDDLIKDRKEVIQDHSNQQKRKQHNHWSHSALGMMLVLFLLTLISVGSYGPLKNRLLTTKDPMEAYIESNDFIYSLTSLTRYLKESKMQGNNDWYDSRYEQLESIKYYIRNKDETINTSNIPDVTEDKIQQQIKTSQFYLHVKTDEAGNPKIESSSDKNFNKNTFINGLNLRNEEKEQYAGWDMVYIVPENLDGYNDLFIYNMKYFNIIPKGIILILAIGAISIFFLIIMAFAIPYDIQRKKSICRLFNALFLEFKILVWIGLLGAFAGGASLIGDSFGRNEFFNIIDILYDGHPYFYMIGIPVTFLLYLMIYLSIVYVKYIYHEGFKEGLIRNSVFGKLALHIIGHFKKILKKIIGIDITKEYNKKLITLLGINLIALWIIAFAGGFGFVLGILYTVLLFKYLLTMMDKVRSLSDKSRQLAEGDFDITLDENMGVLSPVAKNLNNIKEGFKVAIDKEVKSQQMKTELISNVSHDLKTPLTSIITYVDLLKNVDIQDPTQQEYIDVLDRKSKRLKVLIEDLFEASKASSGNMELHVEQVDVVALLRQTLGEWEEKINDSKLQIKTNMPENKVFCELDGRITYRIFENIMSNILKYAMSHSRVYIDVVEEKQQVSFIFKNISAYEMNFDVSEITERFTRGDQSRNTEGSGLGLAIAKSLIELQKGNLSITIDGDLFKLIVIFPKSEKGYI